MQMHCRFGIYNNDLDMVKLVLGLGSNTGNRLNYLRQALRSISKDHGFSFLAASSVYETEPWGYKEQNIFFNMAAVFLCRLNPAEALRRLKRIETITGRLHRGKWQKREIDIDILFYGDKVIENGKLEIPHPFISYRNFVLVPLNEIMPEFIHPVNKKSIKYLYLHSPDTGNVVQLKTRN